jgi:D-xylose transport system substrate-binding protein
MGGMVRGILVFASALLAIGCSKKENRPEKDASGGAVKIAFLLPESKTTRYESKDRPFFEAKIKALCPSCEVLVSNANQDASAQQAQADAALVNGAKVLVVDAVDSTAAAVIANKAKSQGAAVIAYDRLILGTDAVDFYVAFEVEKIGELQAKGLLDALAGKPEPRVVLIHGAPTDNNGRLLKKGVHRVLDGKVNIVLEYDTPDWSPDKARDEMSQALTATNGAIDGVYAANDGTAGGALAALKAAGTNPLPPITGQDAELAAVQRIVLGEQSMSVYKAIRPQAEAAATLAFHLATGKKVPPELTSGKTTDNGKKAIPSVLLEPTLLTKENVKTTVLADGFWKREEVCSGSYTEACSRIGL